MNEIETEWKDVEAGVIQGSALGPILFILFITDINDYIPKQVETEKYADDILSYIVGSPTNTHLPQDIVNGVQKWCEINKMRLNTNKCKIVFLKGKDNKTPPDLVLNNQQLAVVDSYKYIGVELNNKLDWTQQWERVESLINSVPHLLKSLKWLGFDQRILINVYKNLV